MGGEKNCPIPFIEPFRRSTLYSMNPESRFDCIIPVAGLSSRMCSWKPLIDFMGRPMIQHIVDKTLRVCERIVLVCGYRGEELEALFSTYKKVECIRNKEYQRGMFSSIQTGTALVNTPWFFITLGDMPAIPAALFTRLAEEIGRDGQADIIRPVYRGQPGHPVLLRRSVAAAIREQSYEADMRRVFAAHSQKHQRKVLNLDVDTPGCVYDIDTDSDLTADP
ncbi:MAG: nucleotidyltransferase family protein [Sediminispirochaetaceae bacterium]